MRISRLLPSAAASLFLSTATVLADPADWSGFYLGGAAGANFGNAHFSLPGDTHDALQQSHSDGTKFTGGGLGGFNLQSGNFVYGIEGELMGGDNTFNVTACTVPDGCFTPKHDSFTTFNTLKTGTSERLRARFGFTEGDTLFYAAGGYSHAATKLSLLGDCYNAADPTVPLAFRFGRSKDVSGFNLGLGIEHNIGIFFLRGEYVFDDYGAQTWKGDGAEWNDRRITLSDNQLRAAVGIRF